MMAMLELLVIIIKILFLSTIFTGTLFLIVFILSRLTKIQKTRRFLKLKFWLLTHFLCSIILFIISFSYWQDTGIGDNSRIPVGYGQTIQSEDFEWTYFYPDLDKTIPNKDELVIGNYKIVNNFLCAEISHEFSNSPTFEYIVYYLKNKSIDTFYSKHEYMDYATKNLLPLVNEFYDFKQHYQEYLNSRPMWKLWLLP